MSQNEINFFNPSDEAKEKLGAGKASKEKEKLLTLRVGNLSNTHLRCRSERLETRRSMAALELCRCSF